MHWKSFYFKKLIRNQLGYNSALFLYVQENQLWPIKKFYFCFFFFELHYCIICIIGIVYLFKINICFPLNKMIVLVVARTKRNCRQIFLFWVIKTPCLSQILSKLRGTKQFNLVSYDYLCKYTKYSQNGPIWNVY